MLKMTVVYKIADMAWSFSFWPTAPAQFQVQQSRLGPEESFFLLKLNNAPSHYSIPTHRRRFSWCSS